MSLKVWLPLLGNLENKGISNIGVPSCTNLTSVSNGKIGSCYSGLIVYHLSEELLNNTWSLCAWVKAETWYSANNIILCKNVDSGTTFLFYFTIINGASLGIGINNFSTQSVSYTFNTNTWYHVAATYNGNEYALYINGEKKKSGIITNSLVTNMNNIGINCRSANTNGTTKWVGDSSIHYINDVRIYDHCLSAAEVHLISLGLVLHYKLDSFLGNYGNPNLLPNSNKLYKWDKNNTTLIAHSFTVPTNILASLVNLTITFSYERFRPEGAAENIGSGGTASRFGCHATVRWKNSSTSATTTSYPLQLKLGMNEITDKRLRISASYTLTPPSNYDTLDLLAISMQLTSRPTDDNVWFIGYPKLEKGNSATAWTDLTEILNPLIQDSSGYNHNGSILNTALLSSDTPRYSTSINLSDANSMINCGRGGMVTDSITVNFWLKSSAWANPVSCTEGGGWNFEASGTCFRFPVNITDVGYKYGKSTTTKAQLCNNQWHMLTGIYDRINLKIQIYVDGLLDNDYATGTSNTIKYHTSNVIWIGAEATGSNSTASNGMVGLFSDFRIYATALDANAIRQLYLVGAKIDKTQRLHTYEINEDSLSKITKRGQIKMPQFSEHDWSVFLKYDKNVYIEPDGSCWVRIYHHNNPGAGSFSSSNDFVHSVYIDENRWFNVEVCNHVNAWEFMVKGKFTSTSDEWKLRWIQSVNPMTAVFADVAVANITKITTDGYSSSPTSWGGLWAKKSSAYLTANNGNSGNWWGAIGSYSVYQNGIPGWGPTVTITTTGFNDLYIRIDNITSSSINTKITSNKMITSNQFIEF